MNILRSLLPHIIIILSGIFIVFLILDYYNPTMNFISNPISQILFRTFCILSILSSSLTISANRKMWAERNKK